MGYYKATASVRDPPGSSRSRAVRPVRAGAGTMIGGGFATLFPRVFATGFVTIFKRFELALSTRQARAKLSSTFRASTNQSRRGAVLARAMWCYYPGAWDMAFMALAVTAAGLGLGLRERCKRPLKRNDAAKDKKRKPRRQEPAAARRRRASGTPSKALQSASSPPTSGWGAARSAGRPRYMTCWRSIRK